MFYITKTEKRTKKFLIQGGGMGVILPDFLPYLETNR